MTRIKIFSVLLILFILTSSAINSTMFPAKVSSLEIKGYVYESNEKVDEALVKLYQNNKVVQMTNTKKSKFQFILFSDMRYMVEIVKSGSITERIQISTKEKTEFGGKYTYEFRVDLMKESKFKGVDISSLDFPTAVIKYNKEEGEYMHDAAYSKQVKLDLKKLRQEAQAKK
ncbi:MAG: hypothetical protein JKY30_00945 [Flavobacteriales bacterium]|nr:hypothetical protein [Flavobacteriales bacterium]